MCEVQFSNSPSISAAEWPMGDICVPAFETAHYPYLLAACECPHVMLLFCRRCALRAPPHVRTWADPCTAVQHAEVGRRIQAWKARWTFAFLVVNCTNRRLFFHFFDMVGLAPNSTNQRHLRQRYSQEQGF